jgi:hypothetical protein
VVCVCRETEGDVGVWTGQARLHIRRASFMQASRWGRNVSIAAALTCGELGLGWCGRGVEGGSKESLN